MGRLRDCPFCDGLMRKIEMGGRTAYSCVRCEMIVSAPAWMSESEAERRFNRRVGDSHSYCDSVDSFMKKDAAVILLRTVYDYQPCTRDEIVHEVGWMSPFLEKNIREAVDLELVKYLDSDGERMYSLTELGKSVVKEAMA